MLRANALFESGRYSDVCPVTQTCARLSEGLADAALRRRLGAASRRLVESDLSAAAVGAATAAVYAALLRELD